MRTCITTVIAVCLAGMAQAGGEHTGGHVAHDTKAGGHASHDTAAGGHASHDVAAGGHASHEDAAGGHVTPLGTPASAGAATRSVTVSMAETADGRMIFRPARLSVAAGETVRLLIRNDGQQEHEFMMGSAPEIAAHKRLMEETPDMPHTEANAVRLDPGASGEIVWSFGQRGRYEFACLILGHYEAGMHGPLVVE
ncbi:cupredoxin family protein [Cereibacter sphaeroides]|uniref:cupredoxin domain-containing protein n=1 Tax=Cereibacter sphaeroides TaxID=1063 RepID=UPI001F2EDC13|nr:cupredoxin family protein [Cereibacter sphaeroides]MCE6961835.1 cupredoxin family protein [Cereibacter sphaeroides]MCE6970610.1 cupredoxin family protein [Cereibacter sphaeroides]MCE6975794.1 cupredoxin family protein [Cereibacter sphaeroides]